MVTHNNYEVVVVMPAFNAACYIGEAIESVLKQTYRNFKLYIVDDGSRDNTFTIAKGYASKDSRISVISRENEGICGVLNYMLKTLRNEWIVQMHADDVMLPNRLERQLAFISEHPDLVVAGTLVYLIGPNGKILGQSSSQLLTEDAVRKLVNDNKLIGLHHPSVIMRREPILEVGGYRKEFYAEDIDLWNRLVERGYRILVQPEYLLKYRIHGTSASYSGTKKMILCLRWIEECMLRRRKEQPEPTMQEYLDIRRSLPLIIRINNVRKDTTNALYKSSTLHYAIGQYGRCAMKLLAAIILRPVRVPSWLWSKRLRRTLNNEH